MPLERTRIALIEDDPIMGASLVQRLKLEGYDVAWWQEGRSALLGVARTAPDLVLCDVKLPGVSGGEVFAGLTKDGVTAPFVFMTAYGEIDQAVALMRAGAADYVTKPFVMEVFLQRMRAILERRGVAVEGILGVSAAMQRTEALLRRIAGHDTPVLLTGETGVGKEVCARFLHEAGAARGPFLAINCTALPADLMESETFGHERGAFTGAQARHEGFAERAKDGTLFLDEIGDLPLPLQPKLLRLLEERRFTRVGGRTMQPFRARVVCATNADLAARVRAGRFRDDLFYRINVIPVAVPPLRERPDDTAWLLARFAREFGERYGTGPAPLAPAAEEVALAYDWPGNVRELRNRVERAVALAGDGPIMPADLFPERVGTGAAPETLAAALDVAERRRIERALRATGGRVERAAKLLGVARSTMFEKVRRHGLGKVPPPD